MRKIAVVTGIRSEYNLLYPIMKAIEAHPNLELNLIVTGAHLADSYGGTVKEIEEDGFTIAERIESLLDTNTASSRVKSAAIQLAGLVQTFTRIKPDIAIAPFDREEAITVALAGVYMNMPVAHIGGGDRTYGNADDYVRHAVTKLAHLHFTTTKNNAERIIKMGEEPWRVHCTGNPGLDKYVFTPHLSADELGKRLNFDIKQKPLLLLIHHPITTEIDKAGMQMEVTMQAIKELGYATVIIYPNSDPGGREMIKVIEKYAGELGFIKTFKNLPRVEFINLMRTCDALVGNSSCGILESPLLKLPVVNIGVRQQEREHADNVIFVAHDKDAITGAIKKALSAEFRKAAAKCVNPYGDGKASDRIVKVLNEVTIDARLLQKKITY
jgi:GDP/UDP-N,N'-diacetylbacillosamine 2-epimerase (hydrolysing)